MRFFIIIRRNLKITGEVKTLTKTLWVPQAKQLIRLFDGNLTAMVNGLIKINQDMMVDWSFIDKINKSRIGIEKTELLKTLGIDTKTTRSYSKK